MKKVLFLLISLFFVIVASASIPVIEKQSTSDKNSVATNPQFENPAVPLDLVFDEDFISGNFKPPGETLLSITTNYLNNTIARKGWVDVTLSLSIVRTSNETTSMGISDPLIWTMKASAQIFSETSSSEARSEVATKHTKTHKYTVSNET